jgi:hypothetical protein
VGRDEDAEHAERLYTKRFSALAETDLTAYRFYLFIRGTSSSSTSTH